MGQFLGFSVENSTLVAKVRHLSTNHVSPQFHVVFDELFTTIYNDVKLTHTKIEGIFNDLFHKCRENFGDDITAPEGASATDRVPEDPRDEAPELNDDWLSEPERREKEARAADRYTRRNDLVEKQAREFEKLNKGYNPPYPTVPPEDALPDAATVSNSESDSDEETDIGQDMPPLSPTVGGRKVHFDDDAVDGRHRIAQPTSGRPTSTTDNAAKGSQHIEQPLDEARRTSPRQSKRLRRGVPKYNPTSGRSYKLRNEEREHPDIKRCYTSLVTDRMKNDTYIKNNKEKFCCTVGTKQPPCSAWLCCKKQEYKARIFHCKLQEANLSANQLEWEVPSVDALL